MKTLKDHDDGMINPSDEAALSAGFTTERFTCQSYIWKVGDTIYISMVESRHPGRGHFRYMVESILMQGMTVKVSTPLYDMRRILVKNGFEHSLEYDAKLETFVEVYIRRPEDDLMACPTCDHTMQMVADKGKDFPVYWCPRCGTLKAKPRNFESQAPDLIDTPKLVVACRRFASQADEAHAGKMEAAGIGEAIRVGNGL